MEKAKKIGSIAQQILFPFVWAFGYWYWIDFLLTGSNFMLSSIGTATVEDGWFTFAFVNITLNGFLGLLAAYGVLHSFITLHRILEHVWKYDPFLSKVALVLRYSLLLVAGGIIYGFVSMFTKGQEGFVWFLILLATLFAGLVIICPLICYAWKGAYYTVLMIMVLLLAGAFVGLLILGTAMFIMGYSALLSIILILIGLVIVGFCLHREYVFVLIIFEMD